MEYYLQVSGEVLRIWHAFIYNYFLWSIGFRLFEGANIPFFRYITTPPLLSLPKVAPCALAGLAAAFLLGGMIWAMQSKDLVIAFAIIICVIVAVSPISWEHYYVMIIISLAVMWRYLSVHKFPVWQTLIFVLILMMFFLFNEHIGDFVMILNGGQQYVEASGNMITFASSLLFWLPMVELIILTILLLRSGANQKQATIETFSARPHEI